MREMTPSIWYEEALDILGSNMSIGTSRNLYDLGSNPHVVWYKRWRRFVPKFNWKRVLIPFSTYAYCYEDYIDSYEAYVFGIRVYHA
jgi:hypothetical protein